MRERKPIAFVVDDDQAVRESLRLLLRSLSIDAVTLPSARAFLDTYDPSQPGCLILDVRMPQIGGLELQRQLNLRGATIPIVFITGHGDIPMAVEAMRLGAFDFLQKPFSEADLLDRVRRALERDSATRIELRARAVLRARLASLTPRELEVMHLVTAGHPNKVIAAQLNLSQRTVEIHRARVMEKMEAASLAQLVRIVLDLNPYSADPAQSR